MTLKLDAAMIVLVVAACSDAPHHASANERILVMSFPGVPNPPTKNLIRGTRDLAKINSNSSPEAMLSEAFLRCGLRQLSWTSYGSDGGSRLIIPDSEKSRSAVKCVAKTFPLDFYAEPQTASKSDLAALAQTS